jgi:ABC-2 type transport system permease protein
MSTATATLEPPLAAHDRGTRPGLARLAAVELRNMTDTLAGFGLLVTVVASTIAAAAIAASVGDAEDHTLRAILEVGLQPVYVLVPVIGILLVTSEWSQRTALITFALVPQRSRVLAAKLIAGVALALAALVMAFGITAVATAIAGAGDAWSLPAAMLGQATVSVVAMMLIGLGVGAALIVSAPAIVAFFALPIAWAGLGAIPALESPARWLDSSRSFDPMLSHVMDGTEWARVGTTLALWMLVPALVGLWRITRSEVR